MKIGFFGGTFAPAHNGHVNMLLSAIRQLNLDKVIVMPNGIPPHKYCAMDKADRFNVAKLAFDGIEKVEVSDYELNKDGASYSYQTLEYLSTLYPDDDLFFIMGGDSLRDFPLWVKPERIAQLATLVVATRDGSVDKDSLSAVRKAFGARVVFLDFQPIAVSSTDIRTRFRLGMDNSENVPEKVNEYVLTKGIFKDFADKVEKLRTLLEEKRFAHTVSVVYAGIDFAKRNGVTEEDAFLGCLLHDCGKNIPQEDWGKYGFSNREGLLPPIVHCALGVEVAKKEFSVTDQRILDAIRFHTTAKPEMSRLEKLVFVADKAEKNRKYDVTRYYNTALVDLNKAFEYVLYDMYLIAVRKYGIERVDKMTLSALKYYKLI